MVAYAERTENASTADMEDRGMPPLSELLTFPTSATAHLLPLRDEYKAYSRLLSPEGYEGFHDACFWWLLSTIAARRVYADFVKAQYTPLYIALAARTSLYAKTTTADVGREVLNATGLGWMLGADRTTPEKLMSDMSGWIPKEYGTMPMVEQEETKLRIAMAGQLGWINDEFGKFVKGMLKQNSTMANYADLLLTFDGSPFKYRNATISRSSEPIIAPYLSMIGNMTISNVRDNAKRGSEFWSDGFWARFVFITPPPGTYIDEPFGLGVTLVSSSIVRQLRRWHDRLGSPRIDIEAEKDEKDKPTGRYVTTILEERKETCIRVSDVAYEAWKLYRSALKAMIIGMPHEDLDGSYDRLSTKAMRVATLIASVSGENTISLHHWALAQEVAESWRYSLHQFYAQVNTPGKEQQQTMEERIIETMKHLADRNNRAPSARDIAKYLHKDRKDVKVYLSILVRYGVVEEVKGRQGSKYSLIEEL